MSDNEIKDLKEILEDLGYSKDEILVYTSSLLLGSKPTSTIAKHAGLGRSKTYDIINSLVSQGLLLEYSRHAVLHYSAIIPSKFLSLIKKKQTEYEDIANRLEKIIPGLEALNLKSISKTKIELWKGDDAVCSIWDETINHPNTFVYGLLDYSTCWPVNRDKKYVSWDRKYSERRAANNITMRTICNKSPGSDIAFLNAQNLSRQMKVIRNFDFNFELAIHMDSIKVICNNEEVSGIVIRDKILAQTFQMLFSAVWERLPNYE